MTLPEGEEIYEDPNKNIKKFKAHKIILGPRRKINVQVIRELIAEGANIHADNDRIFRWASSNRYFKIIKLLLKAGANVHADNDSALYWASCYGHFKIVKLLLKAGADAQVLNS